jgi:D-tyrosyl-tRNA(Tyr) deacylase
MIALIQRVSSASVAVDGEIIGAISTGLLALVAVEASDTDRDVDRMMDRLLGYRVFPDDSGRMNLSLKDIGGGLLLVPQFTLGADTRKGMRPSFSGGVADPERGRYWFARLVESARERHSPVGAGQFGADMSVSLVNEGPVTFWLQTSR